MTARRRRLHLALLLSITLVVACSTTQGAEQPTDPASVPRDTASAPVSAEPARDDDPAAPGAEDENEEDDETVGEPSEPPAESEPGAASPSDTTSPARPVDIRPADDPGSCIDDLSIRERAALLVWPSVYADDWNGAIEVVRDNAIGGVLLMSQRGLTGDQVTQRLADLETASRHGLIVATDEEGGDVQRLRSVQELPSQRAVARDLSPESARNQIARHGRLVRSLGVDMVLGPVVDVEPNVGEVPLTPSRFFAGPPETVSDFAAAYVAGWNDAGLFATLKHYPGHGAASGDTHITAGITPSLADLEDFDLKPYRDLVELARDDDTAVMIGHLTVPGLTDGVPATRSPAAISYLRDDLGYGDALLVTDALGMAAVGIPEPEASVLALAAGIDVVLFTLTSQTDEVIDALVAAVTDGRIDADHLDAAARKVMRMLARDGHSCVVG